MNNLKEVVDFMSSNFGDQVKVEIRDKALILNQIGSVQVSARFDAGIEGEYQGVYNVKDLRCLTGANHSITVRDGDLYFGDFAGSMYSKGKDYPEFELPEGAEPELDLSVKEVKELKDSFKRALPYIPKKDIRFYLNTANLRGNKVVGSDGHRLIEITTNITGLENHDILFPRVLVAWLAKVKADFTLKTFVLGSWRFFQLIGSDFTVLVKDTDMVNCKYPRYESLIKDRDNKRAKLIKQDIKEVYLPKVKFLSEMLRAEKFKPVKINLEPEFTIEENSKDGKLAVNALYLIDQLKAFSDGCMVDTLKGSKGLVFTDDKTTAVIMSMAV